MAQGLATVSPSSLMNSLDHGQRGAALSFVCHAVQGAQPTTLTGTWQRMQRTTETLRANTPRFQELMALPGAIEASLFKCLSSGLRRFVMF